MFPILKKKIHDNLYVTNTTSVNNKQITKVMPRDWGGVNGTPCPLITLVIFLMEKLQ